MFQLWLSHGCLSASSRVEGPIHSRLALLWYSLYPLFFRAFCREVLSLYLLLFFSSLEIPQFGLLSHVCSLRLSSGHSGPVLTSLFIPCSWVAYASIWATSPLAVAVRCLFCVFFFFFNPPSYVALWDFKTPQRPACERVSCYLETSPPSWLPP